MLHQLNYRKNKNGGLFKDIQEKMGVSKIQNYIPVYEKYFSLNSTNYNSINLNTFKTVSSIKSQVDYNTYVTDAGLVHVKYAPLYDTFKYMAGKLKEIRTDVLPAFGETPVNDVERKLYDVNNSSYTDAFFYFLSSILLNKHGFINGIDFFGSYLCVKKDLKLNIADDVQYLYVSEFFKNNRGKLFNVNSEQEAAFVKDFTRNCKKRLELGETIDNRSVDSLGIIEQLNEMFEDDGVANNAVEGDTMVVVDDDLQLPAREREDSECSSRYSSSADEDEAVAFSSENDEEEWETESDGSAENEEEDVIDATINEFPANLIFIEKMDGTLDSLLDKIEEDELKAALFQVVMSLVAYNKAFDFTHNDLHTNNVMYSKTNVKHIVYKFESKCYKVPTYGRIFKIIDFGRSIYRYNGVLHHNDSYAVDNDAAGQFNFEPYYTEGKPVIMPNYSFDLCRLACSMYDNFFDFTFEEEELGEKDLLVKRIADWCKDDKGKNVLYKKNGEERYEGFKLYKMITRTVHGCVPREEVNQPVFAGYLMSNPPKKDATVIDIDAIPVYV